MDKKQMLIEYIIQDIIEYIVQDYHMDIPEAIKLFYLSETIDKLEDTETGLYIESSGYVYALFKDEMKFGKFVQIEV